jgi:hypothetical protein
MGILPSTLRRLLLQPATPLQAAAVTEVSAPLFPLLQPTVDAGLQSDGGYVHRLSDSIQPLSAGMA